MGILNRAKYALRRILKSHCRTRQGSSQCAKNRRFHRFQRVCRLDCRRMRGMRGVLTLLCRLVSSKGASSLPDPYESVLNWVVTMRGSFSPFRSALTSCDTGAASGSRTALSPLLFRRSCKRSSSLPLLDVLSVGATGSAGSFVSSGFCRSEPSVVVVVVDG